jgi:putative ABC transport system permease protein
MKYFPLVWAAFRRHTTESLLTFVVLTIAFTLFSSMVALKAAYNYAINVNPMDRLFVHDRFCCTGLSIGLRNEMARIAGVRGVAILQGVWGFHQEPANFVGVWMIDGGNIAAIPELRLTQDHWKQMKAKPAGVFFARTQAEKWNVKTGDTFIVQTRASGRQDGSKSWPFEVLGIVDDPAQQVDWMPNIYGNYDYFDTVRPVDQQGRVNFILAIDDPDDAHRICQLIDTKYANSAAPTYCIPLREDARGMLGATISMRQMSLAIGAAGLFMIFFLCANSVAESVRERIPEFAVLKTIGFGDREVTALVFLEAALPSIAGAVFGTALAGLLGNFTSRLGDGSGLNLPPSSISLWGVAMALGVALLIGALSAVLPLRRLKTMELAPALTGR